MCSAGICPGHILENWPEVRNALSLVMVTDLREALQACAEPDGPTLACGRIKALHNLCCGTELERQH